METWIAGVFLDPQKVHATLEGLGLLAKVIYGQRFQRFLCFAYETVDLGLFLNIRLWRFQLGGG